MNQILQQELIKTIMGNFGISPRREDRGILSNDFISDKHVSLEINGERVKVPVIAAQALTGESLFKAVFVNIVNEEFVLAFQMDDLPIYAMRLVGNQWHTTSDEPSHFYSLKDGKLKAIGVYDALLVAAGSEKMASLGPTWQKCSEFSSLYETTIKVMDLDI